MYFVHKYILCGNQDTPRRKNGYINMFNISPKPKTYIEIQGGTHNFEFEECFTILYNNINHIIQQEIYRFV